MTFWPAPLDALSVSNGVAKFDHVQMPLDPSFVEYAFAYLDLCFPAIDLFTDTIDHQTATEILLDDDHAEKASGYPWCFLGGPTKSTAVEKFPDFSSYPFSVVNCTLKDEIRPAGKDSRLFRPASLHDYFEGLTLFQRSNVYMQNLLLRCPVFTRFVHPGRHVSLLFALLSEHGGDLYDADGSQWDAHYPVCVAELIMNWRLKHTADPLIRKRIVKYYSAMYYGWTNCFGTLVHLEGQPSGHFLTTIDNSLCQMVCMAFHAWRLGLPLATFQRDVRYFCCGDDLVWSDRTKRFDPRSLHQSYSLLGCYLEFGSLSPRKLTELSFVGQTCVLVDGVIRYHGKVERTLSAVSYHKKTASRLEQLQKIAMCCLNMRFSEIYPELRLLLLTKLSEWEKLGEVNSTLPAVASLLLVSSSDFSARMYDHLETVDIKAKPPFKTCQNVSNSSSESRYCKSTVQECHQTRSPHGFTGSPAIPAAQTALRPLVRR